MAKNKINEATAVASPRSRCGKVDKDKTKQLTADGTAQELPEWAKDIPEYITVKTWDLD